MVPGKSLYICNEKIETLNAQRVLQRLQSKFGLEFTCCALVVQVSEYQLECTLGQAMIKISLKEEEREIEKTKGRKNKKQPGARE